MMVFGNRRVLCRASGSVALILGLVSFTACAEIEVGAEAAKRISRTTSETGSASAKNASESDDIELAQATDGQEEDLPISPFLEPAPQLFEATGLAVWDGKRTLQGVWVAHPLAESARRVRIFNEENGKAVDGALFKRDSTAEDSPVLISSEAAQLLSMGIGTPALIRIVAVSPIQRQPEAPSEAVVADAGSVEAEDLADETSEEIGTEVAAAAGTSTTEVAETQVEPSEETPSTPETASTGEVEDKVAEAATKVATEDSAASLTAGAVESVAVESTESAESEIADSTSEAVSAEKTTEATTRLQSAAPVSEAETETVEAEPVKAESATVEAKSEPKTAAQEAPRVVAIEPVKPAKPEKSPAQTGSSKLRLPFIQAGIFGVKSNATNLIRRMEAKDLPAFGREIKSGGKSLTKVLAGPFQTSDERKAALRTIRAMGLKDAAPVRR